MAKLPYFFSYCVFISLFLSSYPALAQVEAVGVNLTVQNRFSISAQDNALNYVTVETMDDDGGGGGQRAPMRLIIGIDGAAAYGAVLNLQIDITALPTDGVDTFDLTAFETVWNGGVKVIQEDGVGWVETFDAVFDGGTNTLDIGASMSTQASVIANFNDRNYEGSFDVVFSY